jgi:transposase
MSKLKQLIGLQSSNLSVRALSRALGLSVGAASKYLRAVRACGIGAAEADTLSEAELERRVFGMTVPARAATRAAPDCAWIHGELKRHRHVTLQLLWEEYSAEHGAAAYPRSAFCQIYRDWAKRLKRSMRQRHFAGETMFVDYAGRTVPIYGSGGQVAYQAHHLTSPARYYALVSNTTKIQKNAGRSR